MDLITPPSLEETIMHALRCYLPALALATSCTAHAVDLPLPRLEADPPLPALLAKGTVLTAYRTGDIRMAPVYGAPWHWVDARREPIVLAGLAPGPHRVLLELADPGHKVVASKTVEFVVPPVPAGHGRQGRGAQLFLRGDSHLTAARALALTV